VELFCRHLFEVRTRRIFLTGATTNQLQSHQALIKPFWDFRTPITCTSHHFLAMGGRGLYRKANPARYDVSKGLVRMTWNRVNVYNLAQSAEERRAGPQRSQSLFKQRWVAKGVTRAYHWDHITEHQFLLRHFTPRIKLPDMGSADRHLYPPTAMLCFAELERRLDIVVHRCLFAPSVWAARGLVVQGHVKVNGEKVCCW